MTLVFLCCNYLMLDNHGARAGDADALYQLLFTMAMLAMLEIPQNHSRCYVCGICFSLAFLTKSYHAGIIFVIGGLYMLLTGMIGKLRVKEWLLFFVSMAVPAGIWVLARFTQDGLTFFMTMITEDVLSRSASASEGHTGATWYYLQTYFLDGRMIYWLLLVLVIAGGIYFQKKKQLEKDQTIGYLLWFLVPLLAFSAVSTKLDWYNYPILVPLCMMAAAILGKLMEHTELRQSVKKVLLSTVLIAAVAYGYRTLDAAVLSVHGDSLQTFLAESVDRADPYAGANAFIQVRQEMEDGSVWNANNLFVAEIEGDYRCKPYGVSGYLDCPEKKVLYISREDYENMKEMLTGTILYETEEYLLMGDHL